ncbi:hypothetical protein EJB05_04551, partial [Eragrostis curvula]
MKTQLKQISRRYSAAAEVAQRVRGSRDNPEKEDNVDVGCCFQDAAQISGAVVCRSRLPLYTLVVTLLFRSHIRRVVLRRFRMPRLGDQDADPFHKAASELEGGGVAHHLTTIWVMAASSGNAVALWRVEIRGRGGG